MKIYSISLFFSLAAFIAITTCPAEAKKSISEEKYGEKVFQQYCASCHTGGGNIVNPNRPVAGSDKLITQAIFKSYLIAPPGHMPYYQHVVDDQHLLDALYAYCKSLKRPTTKQAYIEPAN